MAGILRVGTSGFAYPAWSPRFYPEGLRAADLLRHYATRLEACELNNTYYQQPTPAKVDAWLAAAVVVPVRCQGSARRILSIVARRSGHVGAMADGSPPPFRRPTGNRPVPGP